MRRQKPPVARDPSGVEDRTPLAAQMAKRRRGPSASDTRRREEFRRAAESMKGRKKGAS